MQTTWSNELNRYLDRDAVKDQTYILFYGKNGLEYPQKDVFKEYYPNVWTVIEYEKRHSYKNLPIMMQKVEADFMLYTVVDRILIEQPDIPLYTIHDSILTLPVYKDYVIDVIEEESINKYGIKPKLKIEY